MNVAKQEKPASERSGLGFLTILAIFLTVLVIWFAGGFATLVLTARFQALRPDVNLQHTGTFGDTFGAVNSLFSALGVVGVAIALILQFREQRDARIEAMASRSHDADLAMLAARINGHSTLLNFIYKNRTRMSDLTRDRNDFDKSVEDKLSSEKDFLEKNVNKSDIRN
jgi:hypothetical protein